MTLPPPYPRKPGPLGGSKWANMFAGLPAGPPPARRLQTHIQSLYNPDGGIEPLPPSIPADPRTVFLLATGKLVALGRFLAGGLPAMLAAMTDHPGAVLAGGPLTPVQQEVLARLGADHAYVTLDRPTGFAHILTSPDILGDVPFRAMAARLRRALPAPLPATVAILPDPANARFTLINRHSLLAWLRARRCLVLAPDTAGFDDTLDALARATRVIIADPAQAGLLGLCRPGAVILEIAPEGWADRRIRDACLALGLGWHLFLAAPPSYCLSRPPPLGTRPGLGFDIPIADFARVWAAV